MNCEAGSARPQRWQNNRSAEHGVSERSHGDTSTASTRRPPSKRGSDNLSGTVRSRSTSIRLWFRPPYTAPCPRRCSGSSVRSTGDFTAPSACSTASTSSDNSSRRAVGHSWNSPRKRDASLRTASGSRLALTAFVLVTYTLVGAHDQTKATPASGESPGERTRSRRRSGSWHHVRHDDQPKGPCRVDGLDASGLESRTGTSHRRRDRPSTASPRERFRSSFASNARGTIFSRGTPARHCAGGRTTTTAPNASSGTTTSSATCTGTAAAALSKAVHYSTA